MARNYETELIDGVLHEWHPVHHQKKALGYAPVRCGQCDGPKTFKAFIDGQPDGELELILAYEKQGRTIHFQGLVRNAAGAGTFTDDEHWRMFDKLDKKTVAEYAGRGRELRQLTRQMWDKEQAELSTDVDGKRKWYEFAQK